MAAALLDGGMRIDLVQEFLGNGNASVETTWLFYAMLPSAEAIGDSYRRAWRSHSSVNGGAP